MGPVPLSLLLPSYRPASSLVALFSCHPDSRRAARFSRHLLLLSQSALSRISSRSSCLCRFRRSPFLLRRNIFPAHPPKCAPLFLVLGHPFLSLPLARRDCRL